MRLIGLVLCGLLAVPLQAAPMPGALLQAAPVPGAPVPGAPMPGAPPQAVLLQTRQTQAEPLRVAVAANFAGTLAGLIDRYVAATGETITTSSASTGLLYTQVAHGAPFDLLLAADTARPARLVEEGLALRPAYTYAIGKLVLAYQASLENAAQRGITGLLSTPNLNLALANPELAPYGAAAEAVLARFSNASPRRLTGANVGQAMQMWVSGGADAAFVSASFSPAHYLPVPAGWYPRIEQQAVVLSGAAHPARAQAFLDWLIGPTAGAFIRSRGYAVPGSPDE